MTEKKMSNFRILNFKNNNNRNLKPSSPVNNNLSKQYIYI